MNRKYKENVITRRALDLILHSGQIGEIYNIGAGNEKPNVWITKKL